jgi:hypothetical protein
VPLTAGIAIGFALFVLDAMAYLFQEVTYGLVGWAGDVPRTAVDAAHLTSIAWTERILIAVLVLAGPAVVLRAPWTAVSQCLAAVVLALLLTAAQRGYAESHPAPAPTPSVLYAPCYSGSRGPTCR